MNQSQRQYVPEHAVPMTLDNLQGQEVERVKFGKLDVVRVQVVGKVVDIRYGEDSIALNITDDTIEGTVLVQQQFCDTITEENGLKIKVGDYVEVFGKHRYFTDVPFVHAFRIRKTVMAQYMAFKHICALSKSFYEKNVPVMPTNTFSSTPEDCGLNKFLGKMSNFPKSMLETTTMYNDPTSVPQELEDLAAEVLGQSDSGSSRGSYEDSPGAGSSQSKDEYEESDGESGASGKDSAGKDEKEYDDEEEGAGCSNA